MRIQIHKNKLKKYFKMKWIDVPEFLRFETDPANWIAVTFETQEEKKKTKVER